MSLALCLTFVVLLGSIILGICRSTLYKARGVLMDGMALSGLKRELEVRLLGGRVQKIYQPALYEVSLSIYRGTKERLRLSAHPAEAFIYLTAEAGDNPSCPASFCLILRKHLEGAKLTAIRQEEPLERILRLEFEASDVAGGGSRTLVVELMGKHSNLILLGESGVILDAIRRVTPDTGRHRQVMPGVEYCLPPAQEKIDPRQVQPRFIEDALRDASGEQEMVLVRHVAGIGPVTAREVLHRCSGMGLPALARCAADTLQELTVSVAEGRAKPTMAFTPDGRPWCYAPFDLGHVGEARKETFDSVNGLLEGFYTAKIKEQGLNETRAKAMKAAKSALDKAERRLANLLEDYDEAKKAPEHRRAGELIMANLHLLSPGSEAVVQDYNSNGSWVKIPMDPGLSPLKNAQAYFRRHSKAKKALGALKLQIEKARREVSYLEQSLLCVDQAASPDEANAIVEELEGEGYLKTRSPKKARHQLVRRTSKVLGWEDVTWYPSRNGARIYVGRNNRQNDLITLKLAQPEDIWLHAKNVAGSHVLLRSAGRPVSGEDLKEAALLAAYHSRARQGSQVPVDYTLRKDVWKPREARPGMVLYRNHHTLYVTPDEETVRAILERCKDDTAE